eukprot:PhF_6_TR13256/c0_g1_i1/m.21017
MSTQQSIDTGPARGQGRPFEIKGARTRTRTVTCGTGTRKVRETKVEEGDFERWFQKGEAILFSRYVPQTREKMLDFVVKWEAFVSQCKDKSVDVLMTAWVGCLEERATTGSGTNLPETVANYLWHWKQGLAYYRGMEVNLMLYDKLIRGLRSKFRPTTKAIPLKLAEVRYLVEQSPLGCQGRAMVAALWLSTQRCTNLMSLRRESFLFDGENLTVILSERRKGRTIQELKDPNVQIWTGPWVHIIMKWITLRKKQPMEYVFDRYAQREVSDILKKMPTSQKPFQHSAYRWRNVFTMYSIKRGALQHLAAHGLDLAQIACLSLHHRLDVLAIYVGSFLTQRTLATKELTHLLLVEPTHPTKTRDGTTSRTVSERSNSVAQTMFRSPEPRTQNVVLAPFERSTPREWTTESPTPRVPEGLTQRNRETQVTPARRTNTGTQHEVAVTTSITPLRRNNLLSIVTTTYTQAPVGDVQPDDGKRRSQRGKTLPVQQQQQLPPRTGDNRATPRILRGLYVDPTKGSGTF